jgi:hypothetical protein
MARAVIKGLPGNRRPRRQHETPTASDLVERTFNREAQIGCGSPMSPSIAPMRARCTARSCWTCSPCVFDVTTLMLRHPRRRDS